MSFVKIKEFSYVSKQNRKVTRRTVVLKCDGNHEKDFLFEKPYEKSWLKKDLHFCCLDCVNFSRKNGKLREKTEQTCIKKYGVDNPSKSQVIKDKIFNVMQAKYGVSASWLVKDKDGIEKREKTFLEKYGVNNGFLVPGPTGMKRCEEVCLEKYGVTNVFMLREFQKLAKEGMIEKYGSPHALQVYEIMEQMKETCFNKYGTVNPMELQEFKDKIVTTNNERYGVDFYTQTEEYKLRNKETWNNKTPEELQKFSDDIIARWEKLSDEEWTVINNKRNETNRTNKTCTKSHTEDQFYQYLCTIYPDNDVVRQVPLNGWAVDFHIKSLNLYVEFWGDYWHGRNETYESLMEKAILHESRIGKDGSQYRAIANTIKKDKEKALYFEENGLKLIHIWETDFMNDLIEQILED